MQKKNRTSFRSSSRALALEPRLLFDGAGAVAAVDYFDTVGEHQAETQPQAAQPAADARPSEVAEKPANAGVLVIVDSRVPDYQSLIDQLPADATVRVVGADESGLDVVGAELAKGEFEAVHILSHGIPGSFVLGSDTLNNDSLASHSAALSAWATQLTAEADILLYGCDIAQGEAGQLFINEVARLTSADISASTNATGSADKGGDWVLESATGSIEAGVLAFSAYGELLADASFSDTQLPTAPREVQEDGSFGLQNFTVSGTGTLNVTITLTENGAVPATGGISLSTTTGLTFTTGDGANDITMSFSGTATDINAALDDLTYAPTANFNGSAKLAVVSGSNSKNIDIAVIPVNDAPNFVPPAAGDAAVAVVDEEGTGNIVTLTPAHFGIDATNNATLGLFDVDLNPALSTVVSQTPEQIVFEVKDVPAKGRLVFGGGNAPLLAGSLFSLKDLQEGKIKYQHFDNEVRADKWANSDKDSFVLTVRDGAGGQMDGTVNIKINPVNDAPSISGAVTGGVVAYEGRNGVPISVTVDDVDQLNENGNWTFTFSELTLPGSGTTLYLDNNGDGKYSAGTDTQISSGSTFTGTQAELNAKLKIDISNDEPSTSISFKIAVTDDGGGAGTPTTTTATITIDPRENNDHPLLTTNTAPVIGSAHYAGDNVHTITGAQLKTLLGVTDVDSPKETLTYTLVTDVTHDSGTGTVYLLREGKYLVSGGSFTQAELEADKISIVFTGGGQNTSHFDFQIRDGEITAFSVVKQAYGPIDGGTRDAEDNNYLIHSFYVRFDTETGDGGSYSLEHANQAPTVGKIDGIPASALKEGQNTLLYGGNDVQNDNKPGIVITDADNADSELTIRLEKVPTGGHIELQVTSGNWQTVPLFGSFTYAQLKNGQVRYVHDGGEQFLSPKLGFAFSVSDGSAEPVTPPIGGEAGSGNNFSVEATPVNDTPEVSISGNPMVLEGGTLIFNASGNPAITLSDVDGSGDAAPGSLDNWANSTVSGDELYVTVNFTSGEGAGHLNGTLYNGTTVIKDGDTVLKSDIDNGKLKYVHDGSENHSGKFTLTVNDAQGKGNTDGHATSVGNTLKVNIEVAPVNDTPIIDQWTNNGDTGRDARPTDEVNGQQAYNTGLQVYEGGSGVIAGNNISVAGVGTAFTGTTDSKNSSQLVSIDPDNSDTQIQYKILTNTTKGKLSLNGKVLGVGSTFTQEDLNLGRVKYTHDATESAGQGILTDKFQFQVGDSGPGTYPTGWFDIEILPSNDRPTVTAPSGPIVIDSATGTHNPVAGFSVDDVDAITGTGTEDFLQVTVRLLDASGAPITDYSNIGAGGGVTFGYTTPGDTSNKWHVTGGTNGILQLQGTKAQVNAALAGLTVTFANDQNAKYQLQVIVDDRTRDDSGNLVTTGNDANGGELNEPNASNTTAYAVPNTVYDWGTNVAVPTTGDITGNISAKTVEIRASSVNDAPTFTGPGSFTVNEDVRSKVGDSGNKFVVEDAESTAFGTPVSVTVSVPSGTLHIGATGTDGSKTPSGGQAVTITGQGAGSITLTGRADDIEAVLNGRNFADNADDTTTGLYYTSASNVNHDVNGGAGDVTLTLAFNEGSSAIGGDVGSGSVANTVANITTDLTITAINDAPTVAAGTGNVPIAGNSATAVTGFVVNDVDATDGYVDGESDGVIQVTVRVLDSSGNPLTADDYGSSAGKKLGITLGTSASGHGATTVDSTHTGVNGALELRGTRDQINAYLLGLQVTFANLGDSNLDGTYKIEVIADDRLRAAETGVLTSGANGGTNNQQANLPAVPNIDTFDPYTTAVSAYNVYNVTSNTRDLFISSINDPGKITASDVTVDEGSATLVLNGTNGNITIADPDDNGANTMEVTVTVGKGTITAVGGAGGTVNGLNSNTITISGATEAQINSRLQALTITYPGATATAQADWNGSFDVTITYNDKGNTGTRPGNLMGDSNDPRSANGDYSYFDGDSGSSNHLVTTRIITVTVNPVNDAPTRTGSATLTPLAGTEDTDGGSGDTVSNLFGGSFSDAKDAVTDGSSANTFAGIAITTNNAIAGQGKWQYSTDGSTWIDLPAVSANSALLLDSSAKLRFDPADNFHGTPGGLTVRLVDNSSGVVTSATTADVSGSNSGGATRYSDSSNAVTLGTTVANVNDRPTATDTLLTNTQEDDTDPTGATVAALGFGYSDATDDQTGITGGGNAATAFGGIAIVGNSANSTTEGVWQYNTGSGWTTIGTPTDGSALILPTDAQLRFVPVANYNGTPGSLTVRVADSVQTFSANMDISGTTGNQTSTWSVTQTLGTTVDPRNDAPTFTHTVTNPTFTESGDTGLGTATPVKLLSSGTVSDIDLSTTLAINGSTFGAGSVTVTLTDGIAGDVLQLDGLAAGSNGIASITGGAGSTPLVITFTNAATVAQVEAVLAAVEYKNTSDDPSDIKSGTPKTTRAYTVELSDGNNVQTGGNAGGPAPLTATKSGTITLTPANDPPVATNNTNSATEDSGAPATGNLITDNNGSGVDSDPDTLVADLKLTQIVGNTTEAIAAGSTSASNATTVVGKYGTLTIGADGSYSYALDNTNAAVNALKTGQQLTDEVFTYTLSDGSATATATLTITINGHTDGTPQIVPVDGNTGATSEATVHESGLSGGSEASSSKETTTGSITVTAPDGLKEVTIGVTTFTVAQLQALSTGSPPTVIDTGEGELRITGITVNTGPASAPKDASIGYTYTLKAAQTHTGATATESTDVVTLAVKDVNDVTGSGNLTVQIVDDVPTASADSNSITKGAATVTGNAYTNDSIGADGAAVGGPVTGVKVGSDTSTVATGSVSSAVTGTYGGLTLNADGSYSYALDNTNADVSALQNGQTLTDTFTYTITDKDGDISTATVTITINGYTPPPPNQVPVAVDDSFTLDEDTPHTGTLIGNDTPSGDGGNVWSKTTDPLHGTVVVNPGGTFTYTPNPDYNGPDSFTYTITDANGDKSTATVTLTVRPVNDVPVATPDSTTTPKDKPVSGNLASNDMPSPDGGNVWSKTTDPSHGTVVVNPDGTYTYTPNTGFTGTDTFTYTVTDKDGDKSTATVTIKVGDNGVPVAVNDSTTTPKDKPVSGNLAGNDTPSPDGGNVWTKTTDPSHGTVVVNPDGSYTYTPEPGFTGTDSFTYTITDKDGDTSTATVTVTVGGGVTPPVKPPVTPPVNPPVDPTNPPVLPPVIGGPGTPGTPGGPGGPGVPPVIAPVPPVLPSDTLTIDQPVPAGKSPALTLNSPVIVDVGPFHAGERFDDVRRLPLPFHPIVYVNREVASSQAQRDQDDPRGFSDPSAAVPGERPPVSLGAGLGQDPNLFVSHAIRDSQSVASFLRSTVEGRYSRLGLGSDGYLASPGLFSQPATEISELLKEQRKKLKKAAGEASAAVAENGQGDAPATQPQIARAAGQPDRAAARASGGVAAPSFNEQLRSGAARLPMAARKV